NLRTYAPSAENFAVVCSAFASANVTVPGPDSLLHATVNSGPVGGGAGACPRPPPCRPERGGSPYPAHARRYVFPGRTVMRSGPPTLFRGASGAGSAE